LIARSYAPCIFEPISRHVEQANRKTRGLVATAAAAAACALLLALASTGSHGGISRAQDTHVARYGRTRVTAQRIDRFVQVQAQRKLKPGWLVLLKGRAAGAIAVAGSYLAWEFQPSNAHPVSVLMERNRKTGRTRQLAVSTLPQFGLASTITHVVYAGAGASGSELRAIRHDGRTSVVLSRSLAAPFTSRGNVIAWAEQMGANQRVVVRNMDTGRQRVAARMRRCNGNGCYRIDAVTLADDGVVFDRGAIGSQPSLIVRRRLRDAKPTMARVKNDPQPDLAPSSAGAFYFWLQRGWMRWDFGQRQPQPAKLERQNSWVVGYERGRLLLRSGTQCRPRLLVAVPGKRTQVVAAPDSTPSSPKDFGPLCRLMTAFAWHGRRLVVAWAIIPKISLNAHTDAGLVGVVVETKLP